MRKFAAFLLACLLLIQPALAAFGTPTVLASMTGTTGSPFTMTGVTAASGTLVWYQWGTRNTSALTGFTVNDGTANIYAIHCQANSNSNGTVCIAIGQLANSLSSSTVTFTRTPSGTVSAYCGKAMTVTGFNSGGTIEDAGVLASNNDGASTATPSLTSGASTTGNELFIDIFGSSLTGAAPTYVEDVTHGWTAAFTTMNNGSATNLCAGAYVSVAVPGTKIHSPTLSVTQFNADLIIGLLPAGSGGSIIPLRSMTGNGL